MGSTLPSEVSSSQLEPQAPQRELSPLLLIPILVVVVIGLTWANYNAFTNANRFANRDFMSIWSGGKAVSKGLNPYDVEIWRPLRAQYGGEWMPDEKDPYPLWTAVIFAPFSAVFEVTVAGAVWLTASEIMVGASLGILIIYYAGVKLSLLEFLVIMLSSYLTRWTMLTLSIGQMSLVLVFILTLFYVMVKLDRLFWAGFVLTFVAIKPNSFIIFVPMVIIWTVYHRQWKLAAGGMAGAALLFVGSWIVQPGWVSEWVSVQGKLDVTRQTPTLWGVAFELAGFEWWPALGLIFTIIFTTLAGVVLVLKRTLTAPDMVAAAIPFSLLITPYVWAYEHALLFIPLALFYVRLRVYRFAPLVYLLLCIVLPWGLYIIANRRLLDTYSVLVPLTIGVAFLSTLYLDYPTRDETAPRALRHEPNPLQSDR